MKYVIDASIAPKWFIAEADSGIAVRLLKEYNRGIHELIAPELFVAEVANSILSAENSGRVTPGAVTLALSAIVTAGPVLQSSASDIHRAYEIAKQCRVAVYDCFYAAMAEREQCELVTADTLFLRAVRQHYPFVIALPAVP